MPTVAQSAAGPRPGGKACPENHSNRSGTGRDPHGRTGRVRLQTNSRHHRHRSQPSRDPDRDHPAHDSRRPSRARSRRAWELRSEGARGGREASSRQHPRERLAQARCGSGGGDSGDARQRVTWSRSWRFVSERRRSHDSCQRLARRWFYQWRAGGHPRRDPRERVPQRRSCDFGQPGHDACQWRRPRRGGWRRQRWQRRRQLDGGGQPDRTGSRWRC